MVWSGQWSLGSGESRGALASKLALRPPTRCLAPTEATTLGSGLGLGLVLGLVVGLVLGLGPERLSRAREVRSAARGLQGQA